MLRAERIAREILGLWIETTEGAKFWMKVFNDLKTRGVIDILIAVTDGLTGMPAALEAVFPRDHVANLHRASDSQQPRLRQLEGPQDTGRGTASDLCRGQRRSGGGGAGCVRGGRMGAEVPHRGGRVAAGLGPGDPVLSLFRRRSGG